MWPNTLVITSGNSLTRRSTLGCQAQHHRTLEKLREISQSGPGHSSQASEPCAVESGFYGPQSRAQTTKAQSLRGPTHVADMRACERMGTHTHGRTHTHTHIHTRYCKIQICSVSGTQTHTVSGSPGLAHPVLLPDPRKPYPLPS